jgi:branched-chain amino acid transport system ATP-binding protein
MLRVCNVSKAFGGVRALTDVNLAVEVGEIVGLLGTNGAGKTTLLALIAGNSRPTAGDIILDGTSIVGLRPDQIARRGIARTFQIVRPFGGLTVLQNVTTAAMFGMRQSHSLREAEDCGYEVLEIVGLHGRAKDLATELTLSAQKRLEIARALASGAKLLMLDEVMAGLTPSELDEMIDVIRDVRKSRGLTLIVIDHVMRAVSRLSDRIIVLHLGRCIAEGTPNEIAANEEVERVYFDRQE